MSFQVQVFTRIHSGPGALEESNSFMTLTLFNWQGLQRFYTV